MVLRAFLPVKITAARAIAEKMPRMIGIKMLLSSPISITSSGASSSTIEIVGLDEAAALEGLEATLAGALEGTVDGMLGGSE